MRSPIFSATIRIFAASSGGITRPSTPSKPAALIWVSSSSVGRAMSAFRSFVLNVSGAAGAAGLACSPAPRPWVCAPAAPAPRLKPAARDAEVVRNSRRSICHISLQDRARAAGDADYAVHRASARAPVSIRPSRQQSSDTDCHSGRTSEAARRSSSTVSAVASFQPRTRACAARRRSNGSRVQLSSQAAANHFAAAGSSSRHR